jgi:hypothetical protein
VHNTKKTDSKELTMKKLTLTLLLFNVLLSFGQNIEISQLYGKWNFIELQDAKGNIVTELPVNIKGAEGVEKINRPDILLKNNGEYEQKFTEENTDYGLWSFDKKTNELHFELRISPDDPLLNYLKKISKKRKDGFYYQQAIKDEILYFDGNKMILSDHEGYIRIYLKEEK